MSTTTEKATGKDIQIILDSGAEFPEKLSELEKIFYQVLQKNQLNITIDMKNIRLAPATFIVLLIKATSQARRLGGDIKLINVNPMVRNGFVTFTPTTFLTLESSEKYALSDFGETFEPDSMFELKNNNEKDKLHEKKEIDNTSELKKTNKNNDIIKELQTLSLNDSNKIRVGSSADNLYQVCDFVLDRAQKAGFDEHELAKIKVTVYEASLNAVEHSYFSNPGYWIDVYALKNNNKFYIIIHDWGRSFEFDPDREYNVEAAVKQRRTGGFGLAIIKRTVDEIYYLDDKKVGNRLVLIINIKK